jgi:hypothetical protein
MSTPVHLLVLRDMPARECYLQGPLLINQNILLMVAFISIFIWHGTNIKLPNSSKQMLYTEAHSCSVGQEIHGFLWNLNIFTTSNNARYEH